MSSAGRTRAARLATIRALLVGRAFLGPSEVDVLDELQQVVAVEKVPQVPRRHLLQVLHSTRALDTSLAVFAQVANCQIRMQSLGGYLRALTEAGTNVNRLPIASRDRYQQSIVNTRNRYAHQAGAFPASDAELAALLSEMEACISEVVSL